MEAVGRWRKACVRHFYWSVTSTRAKLQKVIIAKFKSFQYHILNQHTDIPERLFDKCAHGVVTTQRLWLIKGNDSPFPKAYQVVRFYAFDMISINQKH